MIIFNVSVLFKCFITSTSNEFCLFMYCLTSILLFCVPFKVQFPADLRNPTSHYFTLKTYCRKQGHANFLSTSCMLKLSSPQLRSQALSSDWKNEITAVEIDFLYGRSSELCHWRTPQLQRYRERNYIESLIYSFTVVLYIPTYIHCIPLTKTQDTALGKLGFLCHSFNFLCVFCSRLES